MPPETIENAVDFPPFRVPADWYGSPAPRATLLLLPALGTAAGYYRPFAEALAGRGIQVLVPELPGTGASGPRPSRRADYGYAELVQRYLPAVVALAQARGGERPVLLAGHSLGAQVAMLGLLHGQTTPAAVVTLAGGLIHYRYWDGAAAAGVLGMACLVAALSRLLGYLPGRLVGFGGPQAGRLMREWSKAIRTGHFPKLAEATPGRSDVPALTVFYEGDFYTPQRSAAALAARLDADLQRLGGDRPGNPHASWARHPAETVRCIEGWLASAGVVPAPPPAAQTGP